MTLVVKLLNPILPPSPIPMELAHRLETLEGATVTLFENGKDNSDKVLAAIGNILVRRYGVATLNRRSKASPYFPAEHEVYDEISQDIDAVVTGIGD